MPLYGVQYVRSIGIYILNFDSQTIIIMGGIVAVLTLLSSLAKEEAGAVLTFIKSLASAYYSYVTLNMFTWFIYRTEQAYAELVINWGLWLYLVIAITIISGIAGSLGKLAEKEKKKEEKEEEEEEEEE